MARPHAARSAWCAGRPGANARGPGAGGSDQLTPRRSGWTAAFALLVVYALTMAPGVTFWDAGEFISAAHTFGIPHPPGTPLYVAIGRSWTLVTGRLLGVARAMNLLSALATAAAGGVSACIVAHGTRGQRDGFLGALAGALCAGFMLSVWANATETEVYAFALLHAVLLMGAAYRASVASDERRSGWVLMVAYLIALIPAVHLSTLVSVPAVLFLAARDANGDWNHRSTALLIGTTLIATGIGRMSIPIAALGAIITLGSAVGGRETYDAKEAIGGFALTVIGASAVLIMLVRARSHPLMNQGDPSTWSALADVIARRQYDVAPMWPRRAPVWLQVANVAQYADWQVAMAWGRGVFTTPARIAAMLVFLVTGTVGWSAMRRDSRRLAAALLVLLVCGTLGVAGYLNMRAGNSLGYGIVAASEHEARERDYFFVLGFWAWGLLAGYGALALVRARRWPSALALAIVALPLLGNWRAVNRRTGVEATAARTVALTLLKAAPRNALLFLAGDNDTYPIWYAQYVEGIRPDVTTVTIPLLGADWYGKDVAARGNFRWNDSEPVQGAEYLHVQRAALIARAAVRAGRPVVVTTQVSAAQRKLLGSAWHLINGTLYLALGPADGSDPTPHFLLGRGPLKAEDLHFRGASARLADDVSELMLGSLGCWRLSEGKTLSQAARDSLEVRCNLR